MKARLWVIIILILAPALMLLRPTRLMDHVKSIENSESSTGISGIDSIYCINLDVRKEKWMTMQLKLAEQGLKVNRVPAINGWTELTKKVRRKLKAPNKSHMSAGRIGCLLSHLSVLKNAKDRDFNRILVLEDDVEFISDMKELSGYLEMLTVQDPDWDVLYLDDWKAEAYGVHKPIDRPLSKMSEIIKKPKEAFCHAVGSNKLSRVYYRHGMYAMVVSKKGIQKIIRHFSHNSLSLPIDIELNHIDQIKMYEAGKDFVKVNLGISDTSQAPESE